LPAEAGKKAPAFSLPSSDGGKVALRDFADKKIVVLYFYPKDNTSGCAKEACAFRDGSARLHKLGAVVLGVSPDSIASHHKFIEKHDLNFPLLADEDKAVCQKYGVWVEKSMYGRKYMGVERSTFVIGKDGKFHRAWRKVKVPGHDKQVLEAVKGLAG